MVGATSPGVIGGEVKFPVVGLGLLLTCLGLFAVTWVAEAQPLGVDPEATSAAVDYWVQRPYLTFPQEFSRRLMPAGQREKMPTLLDTWLREHKLPSDEAVATQQAELNALSAKAVASLRQTLFRQLALDPERGLLQPGLVTHVFLHAGWVHLLVNLFFLLAVALLLEDAWGRGLFLTFFLVGGMVSGAAEYLLRPDAAMLLVGASGAVSACIGAVLVRFATRKLRLGTLTIPVWTLGAFLAGSEVTGLFLGETTRVAVLAHVVGLGFGVAVALGMRAAGLDRTLLTTDEQPVAVLTQSYTRQVELGHQALAEGDRYEARRHFEQARALDPEDLDAMIALLDMDLREGRKQTALPALEKVVTALLKRGDVTRAAQVFVKAFPALKPPELRASFALQVARALGSGLPPQLARGVWARAGDEPGAGQAMANLIAAELALDARDLEQADDALNKVQLAGQPAEVVQRVERARALLTELGGRLVTEDESKGKGPKLARQRQTLAVTVLAARTDGVTLQPRSGQARLVNLADVKAVGAGWVSMRDLSRVLVVYLVLDWGTATKPGLLLRIDSETGGVEKLRPGVSAKDAYTQFVSWLVKKTGALALPSAEKLLAGELPFCGDLSALEEALFAPLNKR